MPSTFLKKIVLCLTRGQASGVHVQNNVENSNNHIVYVTSPLESAGNLKLKYDLIQGYVQGCALEKGVIYGQPCQVQHFSLRKQMQTLACQMSKGTEPRFSYLMANMSLHSNFTPEQKGQTRFSLDTPWHACHQISAVWRVTNEACEVADTSLKFLLPKTSCLQAYAT